MTKLIDATYFAIYDDHNGGDEVPCVVDLDKMEVISFGEATACRWYEDSVIMCEDEIIVLSDGRKFAAIKFDEYDDAVYGGYEDELDRESMILFDADQLEKACEGFAVSSHEDAEDGFTFITCEVNGTPTCVSNADTVASDVHDASEHIKRAVRTMRRNIDRVEKDNRRWTGFYDEYLSKAWDKLDALEGLGSALENLEDEIRGLG